MIGRTKRRRLKEVNMLVVGMEIALWWWWWWKAGGSVVGELWWS